MLWDGILLWIMWSTKSDLLWIKGGQGSIKLRQNRLAGWSLKYLSELDLLGDSEFVNKILKCPKTKRYKHEASIIKWLETLQLPLTHTFHCHFIKFPHWVQTGDSIHVQISILSVNVVSSLNLTLPNYKATYVNFCVLVNHSISHYLTERKMTGLGWLCVMKTSRRLNYQGESIIREKPVYGFRKEGIYRVYFKVSSLLEVTSLLYFSHMFWIFLLYLQYMSIS